MEDQKGDGKSNMEGWRRLQTLTSKKGVTVTRMNLLSLIAVLVSSTAHPCRLRMLVSSKGDIRTCGKVHPAKIDKNLLITHHRKHVMA